MLTPRLSSNEKGNFFFNFPRIHINTKNLGPLAINRISREKSVAKAGLLVRCHAPMPRTRSGVGRY